MAVLRVRTPNQRDMLLAMLELGEFTVAELAERTGTPPTSVRTFLRRHAETLVDPIGPASTGRRGRAWQRYRLGPDGAAQIRAVLEEERDPAVPPMDLVAAEELLLDVLPSVDDPELRSHYLAQARELSESGSAAAHASGQGLDAGVDAHVRAVDLALRLADGDDWRAVAGDLIAARPGLRAAGDGQLYESLASRVLLDDRAELSWFVERDCPASEGLLTAALLRAGEQWRDTHPQVKRAASVWLAKLTREVERVAEALAEASSELAADIFLRIPAQAAEEASAVPLPTGAVEERVSRGARQIEVVLTDPDAACIRTRQVAVMRERLSESLFNTLELAAEAPAYSFTALEYAGTAHRETMKESIVNVQVYESRRVQEYVMKALAPAEIHNTFHRTGKLGTYGQVK